jgi:hypothetical protein
LLRPRETSFWKRLVYQLQSLALLYIGLEDRSTAFKDFLDNTVDEEHGEGDCYDRFPRCGISHEYLL